jgi:CRP-like cAMP-binding protein
MPRLIDWIALEAASPLLAAFPGRARGTVRRIAVPKSSRLFSRGDRPRAMHFVVAGEMHLVRPSLTGHQMVLQRTTGGFLAEASLDQTSYHCDAVACQASDVLTIPRKAFVDALSDEHFRNRWLAHLAGELRRVRAQAERLGLKTAQERIAHYIETEGSDGALVLTRSKKAWADELGLTHEALYRALARMERSGLIGIDGARLSIRP